MVNKELKVTQYAIEKYQRLAKYIEFTNKDKVVTKIIDDVSILKYNCKFGLWYYNEGQDYTYLSSYRDIDQPYNDLFKNYYKLLTYIQDYNTKFKVFKAFNRERRKKEILALRIELVKKCCGELVNKLLFLETDLLDIEVKSSHLISNVISEINSDLPIKKSLPVSKNILPIELLNSFETKANESLKIASLKPSKEYTKELVDFEVLDTYNAANPSILIESKNLNLNDKSNVFLDYVYPIEQQKNDTSSAINELISSHNDTNKDLTFTTKNNSLFTSELDDKNTPKTILDLIERNKTEVDKNGLASMLKMSRAI
jgi:hypothetical protein